ncbi:MAG: peptidoglycan-binding protein [Epsilonproteobacteria bacterium (ex Lamellibrachia satsuma)]|nr:MAG: peptidoglycan-binding protein [Epsilonproteobacteria bacterium (ex Lamellibrachia satsuma)]
MIKIKTVISLFAGALLAANVAYADFGDAVVGGIVGGAVGSVITNEVYNRNRSQPKAAPQRYNNKPARQKYIAPKKTPEIKIQKALSSLGFYHGRIDGEINSFETRSAIKEMNIAYEIGNTASLKPEARDALIFLGTLFEFDRNLIARGNDRRTKGRKIQTALKIHGFYHSAIDGAVGSGTRNAISQYKAANGLSYGSSLDFEEEYQLVSSAKQMNDKNIEDTINTLKGLGQKQAAPVQVLKMQPLQQNTTPSSNQP